MVAENRDKVSLERDRALPYCRISEPSKIQHGRDYLHVVPFDVSNLCCAMWGIGTGCYNWSNFNWQRPKCNSAYCSFGASARIKLGKRCAETARRQSSVDGQITSVVLDFSLPNQAGSFGDVPELFAFVFVSAFGHYGQRQSLSVRVRLKPRLSLSSPVTASS